MKWTIDDLSRKNLDHNYQAKEKSKVRIPKIEKISIEKETIKKVLWVFRHENKIPEYVEELKFHPTRRFRFDWAIPEWKLAIEYEGLMSKKSGHTTISGYTSDCTKYNEAQMLGWRVLRYTAKNYNDIASDLKKIIQKVK